MLQDRQGRLWIGTNQDVLSFDGARFFSLHAAGLPVTSVFNLEEDDEGGILIGCLHGAYRYFQGRLEKLPPDVTGAVRATPAARGLVLVSGNRPGQTEISIYRVRRSHSGWNAEELTGWPLGDFRTRDRGGAILSECPGGWCEYSPELIANGPAKRTPKPLLHRTTTPLSKVVRDRSGCLWFRTLESAAYQCPGDSEPVPLPAAVAGRNVWADLEETRDGSVLFPNASSVALGRPGAFRIATPENGLPSDTIECAIQARDGAIWAGSTGGLYLFPHPFRFSYWKSRYGPFWSIVKSGGRMLAGTSAGVAVLGADGEWSILPATSGLGTISSLLADPDGGVYAAISGKGVVHLRMPAGAIDARTAAGQDFHPQFLARAAEGLWASGDGFYRLVRRGSELIAWADNPDGIRPSDAFVASDGSGRMWGCFSQGLIRRGAAGWQRIAGDDIPSGYCRSMTFPGSGDVWAGYSTAIAQVHADGSAFRIHRFAMSVDAGGSLGYTFGTDARGWLWRGSLDGMFAATEAEAQRGAWIGLGATDGLTAVDTNHDAFFSDADGSVWWSADTGVFHFTPPPDLVEPPGAPGVFLSAFSAPGQVPRPADAAAAFPYRQDLTVHLASLRFGERNSIRIRYRVLPQQKDWRLAAWDVNLGPLSWRNHTLEFQTRFTTGQWSATSRRELSVMPPWWLSLPALLGFAGIGCAGAAGGVAWRKKRKRRARNQLPDLDAWRNAVLTPESQLAGSKLDGRFQVVRMIAQGGFATVFEGRDLRIRRPCAIKVFRQETLDDQWIAHRFQQEVSALEQIRHRSVVSIYGHGLAPGGAPYLVMELIEGGTLRELVKAGRLPLDLTASLLRQAGDALAQIHARGIFHRDLKPENLMLREGARLGEELVLIDFSIAIVKEPDQTIHGLSRAAGTIYYMAPEQAVGFATAASDIYGLAKTLLEMLTGQRLSTLLPDAGMDLPEKVRELVRGMSLRLSQDSVELIGSALEFDPAKRPQEARQFVAPIVRDLLVASSGRAASLSPSPKDGESAAGSAR